MPTPQKLKFIAFYKSSMYLFLIVTIALGVWPGQEEILDITHQDKILHFAYYFLSASYFVQFLTPKKSLILLFLVGIMVEMLQYFLPYRSADLLDVLANTLGLFVCWLLMKKFSYLRWLEQKFLAR